MFRTIVWATDGSAAADAALPYAKALAAADHGKLVAVYGEEHFVGRASPYPVQAARSRPRSTARSSSSARKGPTHRSPSCLGSGQERPT